MIPNIPLDMTRDKKPINAASSTSPTSKELGSDPHTPRGSSHSDSTSEDSTDPLPHAFLSEPSRHEMIEFSGIDLALDSVAPSPCTVGETIPPLYLDREAIAYIDAIDTLYFLACQQGAPPCAIEFVRPHFTVATLHALEAQAGVYLGNPLCTQRNSLDDYIVVSSNLRSTFAPSNFRMTFDNRSACWDFVPLKDANNVMKAGRPSIARIQSHLNERVRLGRLEDDVRQLFAYTKLSPDLCMCLTQDNTIHLQSMDWDQFKTKAEHYVVQLAKLRTVEPEVWASQHKDERWLNLVRANTRLLTSASRPGGLFPSTSSPCVHEVWEHEARLMEEPISPKPGSTHHESKRPNGIQV